MKADKNQAGGISDKEMPIHISNISYYDKELKKGIKIGFSLLKDGTKVRINKKGMAIFFIFLLFTNSLLLFFTFICINIHQIHHST